MSERAVNRPFQDNLEKEDEKIEIRKITKLLKKLDQLYTKITIKVQKIGTDEVLGEEHVGDLYSFLTGTKDHDEIVQIIEEELKRKLKNAEIDLLLSSRSLSFIEAIRILWTKKYIDNNKARALLIKNSFMTSEEIIKLFDLGAARTSSGYLVQIKTGDKFGNPIKLFEEFHTLADALNESHGNNAPDFADHLLRDELPNDLMAAYREHGPSSEETLSDARVISEIRRHFIFLSRIGMPINFRPGTVDTRVNALMTNGAPVNLIDFHGVVWTPAGLNAVLTRNDYFLGSNSSLTNSAMLAPFAATYWGSYNWTAGGMGWWMSYTDKYLGLGGSYTVNFASGSFWSNGAPTYIMFGGVVAGWRNYLSAGFSLMTMLSSTVGAGASLMGTVTRDHDVYYKGLYPMDGRFSDIRGLHKIEIVDRKGFAIQEAVAANFSNLHVPLMVAFRAGEEFTTNRIFRTHEDLGKAQRMLTEADIPGVLFLLGKKIKESKLPSFEHPERFKVGDELIETKLGRLSGAFVMGLQTQIPIGAVRWGATVDLTAEFELALRKLPGEKYEVSIEPKRVHEIGLFASILNVIGAGVIDTVSIARKQSFIFDFNMPEAQIAYRNLIDHGIMPSTAEEIPVHTEDRGPEYLLTEFRAQNETLKSQGIARSYVEKIEVSSDKVHAGLNSRLLSGLLDLVNLADKELRPTKQRLNLSFAGIDQEFVQSEAKSLATNGLVAIRRSTAAHRKSEGQAFSGRYNQDLFITSSRIHTVDESLGEAGNKWQFGNLVVHAQLEDTVVTGNQENEIVEKINRLFSAFINSFELKNSRFPRVVNLERTLLAEHLDQLTRQEAKDRIDIASHITHVSQASLSSLIKSLKNKHPDLQAIKVQQFIASQPGISGFAAIHQLLGAKPEDLHIHTESHYNTAINQGKTFIAKYSASEDSDTPINNVVPKHGFRHKRAIKKFYNGALNNLRQMDLELRYLHNDPYLIDEQSYINEVYGESRVKELVKSGVRQDKSALKSSISSTRKEILQLLDLEHQGYTEKERETIYKMAGRKRLPFDDIVEILLNKYEYSAFSLNRSKSHLQKRYKRTREMLVKIDKKIKKLEKDKVMKGMDGEYVERRLGELRVLRQKVLDLVNLSHLVPDAKVQMHRKVGKFYFVAKNENQKNNEIKIDSKVEPQPAENSSYDESISINTLSQSGSSFVKFEMDLDT